MHQHPAVSQALAQDRVARLRQSAQASPRIQRLHRPDRVSDAARRRTGWLLVEVAGMIVFGLLSMGLDRLRRLQSERAQAKISPPQDITHLAQSGKDGKSLEPEAYGER